MLCGGRPGGRQNPHPGDTQTSLPPPIGVCIKNRAIHSNSRARMTRDNKTLYAGPIPQMYVMILEYINAALEHARYEIVKDTEPHHSEVPKLPGCLGQPAGRWKSGGWFDPMLRHRCPP